MVFLRALVCAQEARLVLMSKRDGAGAHAATLVFHLRSRVNTRAPLKRVRTEGPLYELQQFEFTITNPFKTGETAGIETYTDTDVCRQLTSATDRCEATLLPLPSTLHISTSAAGLCV